MCDLCDCVYLRIKTHAWVSNIEYHSCIFTIYHADCLLYIFKFITMEVNWQNSFPKNTAIHMSFLTHMAALSSACQLSYLESFFIPAGCLGWCRQYMHLLSAAAFAELSATFPKIVAAIFFFLLPTIQHTSHFILIASISHFADFSPSMLKFRHSM